MATVRFRCCNDNEVQIGGPLADYWTPKGWHRCLKCQSQTAKKLWGVDMPTPHELFSPRTLSEVPLAFTPLSLESLWVKMALNGVVKSLRASAMLGSGALELAPNGSSFEESAWLIFDPEFGRDASPEDLWQGDLGDLALAGPEVLSALTQFPGWVHTWLKTEGSPAPNLSGYQVKDRKTRVLYLIRLRNSLEVFSGYADEYPIFWSSPSVRVWH